MAVSADVIIRYSTIDVPVQTNVHKVTQSVDAVTTARERVSLPSISSEVHPTPCRGKSVIKGALNLIASFGAVETTGNQLPINETEGETSAIALVQETKHLLDGIFAEATSEDKSTDVRVLTRFVMFLCDSSYFKGAVALVASLSESSMSTSLPPLVMVVGNGTIRPFEQAILEALGAQVKMVDQPQELTDAIARQRASVEGRWQGVFSKFLVFRRDIVECDIAFYIDIDSLVRGNLIDCMYDIIQLFSSKPQLEILAVGSRTYFNNGVMLVRPRDTTFSYLVKMLQNGTCVGRCTDSDYTTMMRREIYTDQDVFIEYSERFPERFEPVVKHSCLNLRPKYQPNDMYQNCSVVHYVGTPKPWEAWFAIPRIDIPVNGSTLSMLPDSIPESIHALKKQSKSWHIPDWALELWRSKWNHAVNQLLVHAQMA